MKKIDIDYGKKQAIATVFRSKTKTIKEIAACVGVSARTIGRILVEMGEMPAKVKKTKAEDALLAKISASGLSFKAVEQLIDKDVVDILTNLGEEEFMRVTHEAYLYYISKRYNVSVQAATLKMQQVVDRKS